jgi:hypothetical protein
VAPAATADPRDVETVVADAVAVVVAVASAKRGRSAIVLTQKANHKPPK